MTGHERSQGGALSMPIPGAAGAAVHQALRALALRSGEGALVIRKTRAAGGAYVYVISTNPPPAVPVTEPGVTA